LTGTRVYDRNFLARTAHDADVLDGNQVEKQTLVDDMGNPNFVIRNS